MLEIDYRSASGDAGKTYPVHPLAIVVRDSTIYLVGRIRDYDDTRLMAIQRIASARLLDQPIISDPDFSIDDFLQENSFQILQSAELLALELRISNQLARFIAEAPISEDQTIKAASDEWQILTASVHDSTQLRTWLLSLGEAAVVVSPNHLRDEIRKRLALTIERYVGLPTDDRSGIT